MKKNCATFQAVIDPRAARSFTRHAGPAVRAAVASTGIYATRIHDKQKPSGLKVGAAPVCISDDSLMTEFLSVMSPERKKAFLDQLGRR